MHVENGVFMLSPTKPLAMRLGELSVGLDELIGRYAPDGAAVETVFTHKNIQSAIVLAQARGALLAVLGRHGIPVFEYSPAEVKTTVVGYGRAEKSQVQRMVQVLLGLPDQAATDASDALAIGICHVRAAAFTARTAGLGVAR